uniref:HEAT repeat-containing protein 1 n=1 Tax=Denticeps clupeoides TaxID=299321 RepID=A0AAY4AU20_9TELE
MTSLAHQLKRLALPQNDPSLLSRREVTSLLFDPKEAASMDRGTFYALGCTGLDELLGIEPAFAEFQDTLFNSGSVGLERSIQTKKVNKKLNKDIGLFLTRLSPYFLLKPALKCAEWLIHRFHIHLYNQDCLVACALPYHETKVFVRVIQLLKIEDPTDRWNWLHGLQKPGVPLARGTLLTHCYKDLGFMDFICSLVTQSVKAYSEFVRDGNCPQLRVIISFYASTIVSALDAVDKITDSIIAKILPHVHLGLKSSLLDYKAASYMIVCQLAVKVVMEPHLVNTLAALVSRCLCKTPELSTEGLGCLIVLLQNQKEGSVGRKVYGHLCEVSNLVSTLHDIAAAHDVSALLRYFLPHLVRSTVTQTEESSQGSINYQELLNSVLQNITLSSELDSTVAKLLLEEYLSYAHQLSSDKIPALNQHVQPVVQLFESKYPATLDTVLDSYVSSLSSEKDRSLFHQFISLSMSRGKYEILAHSETSLMLSLKHPLATVRSMALQHLQEILKEGTALDEAFLKDALLERMDDDVPEVVLAALKALEVYVEHLDPADVTSSLLALLHRSDLSVTGGWFPVMIEAVRVLDQPRVGERNLELKNTVCWELLPFLVITSPFRDSPELQLASTVAKMNLLSEFPITQDWSSVLTQLLQKTRECDVVGVVNNHLISTMVKNLSAMDAFSKRNSLERVVKTLGKQKTGLRQKAAFMVLSHTLLQTLGTLSETQHLHIAQMIYSLLEPKVTELISQAAELVLGEFLHHLRHSDSIQREQAALLLSLLNQFISCLKSPQLAFRGEVFWNPEKMDTNTCAYLGLLCRLFELIITGTSQGPLAMSFRALMNPFFQVHLGNPVELFKFLSLLWGYSSNIGDHLDCRVGAVLQTQALYVGRALLAAQPIKNLNMLASAASPVVPTLLLCLSSAVCEVRRAAIATLEIFLGVKSSPFHLLIVALQKATDELISDPTYINQALGKLYEDALVSKGKLSKHQESVEELFKCLQNCPTYTGKTMLRVLQEVNGEGVLAALLPPLEQMIDECVAGSSVLLIDEALLLQLMLTKYNKHSAPLLAKEPRSLEVLIRAMHIQSQPFSTIPSFQVMALEQITKPFFAALGEKTQQRILEVMFDLLVDNKSPVYVQTVNGVFKAIVVDAELVANELTPADKPKAYLSVQLTRRSKMNTPDAAAPTQEELASAWQRVTLILELLQHKKKLKRPQMLVPALFNLLSRYCFEADAAQLGNMEYTKQLILSCLLNICQKLSPAGKPISKDVLDEDKMNVELVVQCIRVSDKPQTHHHALLLLGTIAGIFPEKVLHNIMPIFTFMGANIMRLDDSYSFQVINKTVQTVIPALIQAYEGVSVQSETYMECVVTKIMHVFADALPHVPEHRRLPILSQLLGTVGPARFLWVLLLLLFKQHATHTTSTTNATEKDENDMEFWILMCCEFTVQDQLTTVVRVLQYLMILPQDKEEATEKRKTHGPKKEETVQDLIFCVERQSGKELRHFKFLTVTKQVIIGFGSVTTWTFIKFEPFSVSLTLYPHVRSLLEENLRYIHTVARCVEDTADKPTAKFWRALLNKSYDVLDKVNALLPHDTFIRVVRGLMGNQLPSVRRKAMELLNNRLQQKIKWQEEQVTGLLQLIGDLQSIVGQHRGPEEQAINRQTALYSLKLLCRNFGSTHKEPFVPVLSHVVELVSSPSEEKNVMGSALLCIAEVTITLKALAIPQLHRLMPAVLHTLKKRKDLLSSEVYLLSAVTSLQRVCEALPHFISPYLLDTLLQVARLTRVAEQTTTCPQLAVRLASLRNTLATKLPPRVLLPNITKCYNSLVETQQSRLGPLMGILKEHIAHMEKDLLNSHQTELTTFFLCALDFRAQHGQADLHRTKEIEGSVIDCLLVMVIKLSEVTFRPLFFKLFDWCKTDNSAKDRLLTFYRLSDCIAEKLKGLFVLFAGQLVKPFTDMLRQTNIANTDEAFFDSSDSEEKTNLLLGYILQCLHKIFLYDTQKFLSKERSDALMGPLVDQLENMLGGDAVYQERVTQHLVPCIGQFSVALGDDSQWRVLNYQILLKTRHSSPKVRFSALLMVLELASKLRENYIVLLPETIPFLAELMEDECEEVEHQVQKVIQEMEAVLGEPLQSYF